jgi:hypothetical protein
MAPDRPPRPANGVTVGLRHAILGEAARLQINARLLVDRHVKAEFLPMAAAVLPDIEVRYQMPQGKLINPAAERLAPMLRMERKNLQPHHYAGDEGSRQILLAIPDAEFLAVIENVLAAANPLVPVEVHNAEELLRYVDRGLRSYSAPYRLSADGRRFEWVGDRAQHALTVEPALLALSDERLAGARGEFADALTKRRGGAPKDLEDAVDEAAKSVESVLKVLHHENAVPLPAKPQLTSLFNNLASSNVEVLPGYLDHLVRAAGGPRNHMASHGQGTRVREVPEELADASIAAAAVAITLLAHYLP